MDNVAKVVANPVLMATDIACLLTIAGLRKRVLSEILVICWSPDFGNSYGTHFDQTPLPLPPPP